MKASCMVPVIVYRATHVSSSPIRSSEADKRGADDKPKSSKGYGIGAQGLKQGCDIRTFLDADRYLGGLPKQRSNSL